MNTNPNGYSGGDVAQFQDAGPWLEGCDVRECTAPVGGDHAPTCEVSKRRCYLCRRDLDEGWPYTNVDFGLHVEHVCDVCMEKADEGIDIPLDYTEDIIREENEMLHEGQPEFNGSFG
jgi:hypothetical protein